MINASLDSCALKRMLNTLVAMYKFTFRRFSCRGFRQALLASGWELFVIHRSKNDPLSSLPTIQIQNALLRLTRRHRIQPLHPPYVFTHYPSVTKHNTQMENFWLQWDNLAEKR